MLYTNIFILATDARWNLQDLNTCSGRCKVIYHLAEDLQYTYEVEATIRVHKLGMICNKQSSLMSISSISCAFSYTSPSTVVTYLYFSCLLQDKGTGLVIGL
jgi:hypothetical protein